MGLYNSWSSAPWGCTTCGALLLRGVAQPVQLRCAGSHPAPLAEGSPGSLQQGKGIGCLSWALPGRHARVKLSLSLMQTQTRVSVDTFQHRLLKSRSVLRCERAFGTRSARPTPPQSAVPALGELRRTPSSAWALEV